MFQSPGLLDTHGPGSHPGCLLSGRVCLPHMRCFERGPLVVYNRIFPLKMRGQLWTIVQLGPMVKGPSLKGGKVLLGPKSPQTKLAQLPLSLLEMRIGKVGESSSLPNGSSTSYIDSVLPI